MNVHKCSVLFLSLCIHALAAQAQENIPIGIFRLHASFNSIHNISFDGVSRTFAAAPHGILVVDRVRGETSTYTKANGLSGGTITGLAFDPVTGKLIVGYSAGYIDVWNDELTISHYDPISNSSLSGSAKVNEITVGNQLAYVATDYGVVVFDLRRNQVRETWRDLGISGETLAVHHCTLTQDSVFLATQQGVMAGKLTDNLQDYSQWKRYLHWPFSNPISGLALWRSEMYAAVSETGLFRLQQGTWTPVAGIPVDTYYSLQSSDVLTIAAKSGAYEMQGGGAVSRISSPLFDAPRFATTDSKGVHWIGDDVSGLLTDSGGAFTSLTPQGPGNDIPASIYYSDGKIFAVGGGYDATRLPLHHRGVVDKFEAGRWVQSLLPVQDLTDVLWDESTQTLTTSSYGAGTVVATSGKQPTVFNETNSTLLKAETPADGVLVTSIARASDGVLALNYGVSPEVHRLDAAGNWKSFGISVPTARYGLRMAVDGGDNVWIAVDPYKGGGLVVANRASGSSRLLTDVAGQGALPHQSVLSLCLDREGTMWIGTAAGVAYFPNASSILQAPADAVKPIEDNRFVLREDAVTAIAVDGGNRKWFGTQRGVWLYNAAADVALGSFTASNSVIPSDRILDIGINQESGEVFIATDQGLASYRSGATSPRTSSGTIKIFPNPVPAAFQGTVGITGTPTDAVVKITDASGRLVWETRANGSTATWNLNDDRGRRVPTGMYIVFTVSADGDQHEVGKLAVVN